MNEIPETPEEKYIPAEQPIDELDTIKQKCMDSPGYVIFAGYLSKDSQQIHSLYRRFHMGFEDTFKINKMMKEEILKDIGRDKDV